MVRPEHEVQTDREKKKKKKRAQRNLYDWRFFFFFIFFFFFSFTLPLKQISHEVCASCQEHASQAINYYRPGVTPHHLHTPTPQLRAAAGGLGYFKDPPHL